MSNMLLPVAVALVTWAFFMYARARRWRGPWRDVLFVGLTLYFLWLAYSDPSRRPFSLFMVFMGAVGYWNYRRLRRIETRP